MKNRRAFWILTGSFILFLAAVITWANRGTMPRLLVLLYAFPAGDKVGHFLLMGILALLVNMGLGARRLPLGRRRVLVGSLVVAVIITLEEASQLFLPNRTFSLSDLAMGYLGILVSRYPLLWITDRHSTAKQRSSP